MLKKLSRRRQEGATAVEYGLIVGLIAAIIILAVSGIGTKVRDAFQNTSDQIPATR